MDRSGRQLALPDSESVEAGSHAAGGADDSGRSSRSESDRCPGPGFVDVLNFGFQWSIPSIDLTRVGVVPTSQSLLDGARVAYTVGSGHTATVVQHETGDEELGILPRGTTVALKTFTENPVPESAGGQQQGQRSSRSQTYAAILDELSVFCRPQLSEHPNIVKLLFLGWRSPNPFPVIGMELGEYGSLDYILRAPGTGLSKLQSTHIIMDIAVGLHALHAEELVHGDLKPANIIVFRHHDAARQLVAKLTDFGGASRMGTAPGFITSLWSAPEVLHGDPDIEWDRCDVYSYGLVVASIWARPEPFEVQRRISSCILESFIPTSLTGYDERENFLLFIKSIPAHSPESVLQRTLGFLSAASIAVARNLLEMVLVPHFWQRPAMRDIITRCFADIEDSLGRNLAQEIAFQPEQRRFVKATTPLFKVWSPSFRKRSREFQEYVLSQLKEEVGGSPDLFDAQVQDIPQDVNKAMSPGEYIHLLIQGTHRRAVSATGGGNSLAFIRAGDKGRICFHIALCYLYPVGADFSLETGMRWLRAAVLGGYMQAAYLYPILQHRHPEQSPPPVQERLLLVVAGLTRSLPCLDILASKWPRHYQHLMAAVRGQHSVQLQPASNDVYHICTLVDSREGGGCPVKSRGIWDSLMSYNLDHARQLLERRANDGQSAAAEDDDVVGALHALTYLRDVDAASLARLAVSKGADLNAMRPTSQGVWATSVDYRRVTSALSPAVSRGQLLFARTLIDIHEEQNVPIKDYLRALIASIAYWHHDLAKKLLELKAVRPLLCDVTPPAELGFVEEPALLDPLNLLVAAMDDSDMHSLENRAFHGSRHDEAYANTLTLLMQHGANPTHGFFRGCPLYRCLDDDDPIALRCFIRYLRESYDGDPLEQVVDPGHCRGQVWSANGHTGLQTCIYSKSRRCFYILLDEFPLLVEKRNLRGLTALHSATFHHEDLGLLQTLLDRGADVLAVSKDNSSPLFRALRNRNIEAADLIARYCSSEKLAVLFRRQPDTGRSLFSRLMDAWLRDRDIKLLASFRWAVSRGAAHFYGTTFDVGPHRVEKPLWNDVLAQVRPLSKAWQLRDLALLNLLFGTFPERINELQQDGRGPLHVATWYGHVEAVRSLLHQHGADVNLEFGLCEYHPSDPRGMLGRTALNLAIARSRASGLPDEVRRGGHEDVVRWQADMATIQDILRAAGARPGSGGPWADTMEALASTNVNMSVTRCNEPGPHDDMWRGRWPEPLPRDPSSGPLPDPEELNARMSALELLQGPLLRQRVGAGSNDDAAPSPERDSWRTKASWIRHLWRLPSGWELRITGGSGRLYFVDHNTRSTTWNKPPLARPQAMEEQAQAEAEEEVGDTADW